MDSSDFMIATPGGIIGFLSNGTWETIRYFKKKRKDYCIIYPNGSRKESIQDKDVR